VSYDASSITVLPGMKAVRAQPAMYVGSTGDDGLHHLVFELVENAIDESLAGHCTHIGIVLHVDGSCTVTDNGRGIPVDLHSETGRPACEVVLTTLHAGGKFQGDSYGLSGGLHGVGLSCVNALSTWLRLEIRRDGATWSQRFAEGEVQGDLQKSENDTGSTGTSLHFLPDAGIFTEANGLSTERIANRLQELAFLHPGLSLSIDAPGTQESWCYESGILGFVEHLNRNRTPLHPDPIHIRGNVEGVEVEAALQWTTSWAEEITSYTNSIHTHHGGTHVAGLHAAIGHTANRFAADRGLLNAENGEHLAALDVIEGLTCVLSLKMPGAQFEGQTKAKLSNPGAMGLVRDVVIRELSEFLETHPDVAANIVGKAIEASRARAAARRASERARYQAIDPTKSKEIYQKQFGIRSANWHDSCTWLTDTDLLSAHADLCKVGPDAKLLDVCCGSGVVSNSFGEKVAHKTGLDLTAEMRALASTRLDEVVEGNVYKIPFEDNHFDIVVTREVLHLLPQPEKPLSEIFRVLKPGGQFIVGQIMPYGVVDAAWMFRIFKKKQPLFFNNFLEPEFRDLLAGVGFALDEVRELLVWEDIDLWIDTHETTSLHRHEIRDLYYNAPRDVRAIHPFEITADGTIRDQWRWCIYSSFKPL
jgi:DNA gyrase subunit B